VSIFSVHSHTEHKRKKHPDVDAYAEEKRLHPTDRDPIADDDDAAAAADPATKAKDDDDTTAISI
jgi:hypothetical protein